MADIRSSHDRAGRFDVDSMVASGLNPNYQARIVYQTAETGDGEGTGVIRLPLPENFQLNFSSSFDQPFSQGIVQTPGLQQVMKFAGASLTSQSMSVQVWQGTACPEFNLTFELVAESDPVADIEDAVKKLSKLALPGVAPGGLLTPPGPRIDPEVAAAAAGSAVVALGTSAADVFTGDYKGLVGTLSATGKAVGSALDAVIRQPKNNVTLHIGRFLRFPSVVIQNVSQTYQSLFDAQGRPIRASIDISFSTWYVPVKSDVDYIFQGGS